MHDHRPSLRGRIAALDDRLRAPSAVRTIAMLVTGLLAVQGTVLVDRSAADRDVAGVSAAALATAEPRTAAAPDALAAPAGEASVDDAPAAETATDAAPVEDPAAPTARAPARGDAATGDATGLRGEAAPSGPAMASAPTTASDPAGRRFDARFPAQAEATQSSAEPATTRWAVLIGVNEHSGRTRDNVGSRQDAEDLHGHLRSLGWRDDHMVLLTDGAATRENIVEAFRWLQRKADRSSVVVVHYSGHTKQWHGRDADGDGEVPDEALWPSDNRFITDREVGQLLGAVKAGRLWFNVGACEGAGYNDWGITGPNRIATYSSGEHQKSYEDPSRNNSVWGFFLIQAGMIWGHADANEDGNVTVEEAFRYATPRTDQRTRGQAKGRQTPEVSDRFTGEFDLRIPPPPKPRSSDGSSSSEDDDRPSCLLCRPTATAPRRH